VRALFLNLMSYEQQHAVVAGFRECMHVLKNFGRKHNGSMSFTTSSPRESVTRVLGLGAAASS
jgi:hypothetical protein